MLSSHISSSSKVIVKNSDIIFTPQIFYKNKKRRVKSTPPL
nr:MAG TPA: hypothetical protein [Caudoviricetes sp.]